jgi:hypothetical protein
MTLPPREKFSLLGSLSGGSNTPHYRAASQGLVVEQLGEVVRHLPEGDAIDLTLVARAPMGKQP